MSVAYRRDFYEEVGRGAAAAAREVLPIVFEYVQPKSVVDVGCGNGAWLAQSRQQGVQEILGIDGPWIEPDLLSIPHDQFQVADLSQPLAIGRKFDLVVSLEVAEHLPPEAADVFVQSLTTLGSTILFSAAIPYQGGTRHLNEEWPSYWFPKFAVHGFRAVDCLRPRLWQNATLDLWYAQNTYFLVKTSDLARWPALADVARHLPTAPLDLVHPRLFLQSTAFAKPPAELFHGWLGSLRDRWITARGRDTARDRARMARWPVRADGS